MRIVVDRELCETNMVCVRLARQAFRVDEATDKMVVVHEHPGEDLLPAVERAVKRCPRGALKLVED